MYDQWRCKRCETYNDERDEKCAVCGYEHSRQMDPITAPVWIDESARKAKPSAPSGSLEADEVIAPVKKKVSGFRILLSILATFLVMLIGAAEEENMPIALSVFGLPLILLWTWALKKK